MSDVVQHTGEKKKRQSEHFRRFAADTFGLRLNANLAQVNFSLDTQEATEVDCVVLEATAVMSLPSMKVLQILLTNAIKAAESQFGPIVLEPGKEEELAKRWEPILEAIKKKKGA